MISGICKFGMKKINIKSILPNKTGHSLHDDHPETPKRLTNCMYLLVCSLNLDLGLIFLTVKNA